MASQNDGDNFSVSVPIGAVAGALVLAAAGAAAYMMFGQEEGAGGSNMMAPGRGMLRKIGLMGLITVIENDVSRKVLIAVLRAMARRS